VTRFIVPLRTRHDREVAKRAIERAPDGYVADIHESRRSDDQNRALWGLLNQIQAQRPEHNGVRMTPELWKATFMDALGSEMTLMPKLDGDGFFPLGHSTSRLTVSQFADLLTLILAWAAREGLEIRHFDEAAKDGEAPNKASPKAA
jgi:hypothetical protein